MPEPQTSADFPPIGALTWFERLSFNAMHKLYRRTPGLQDFWLHRVSATWMTLASFRMIHCFGLERLKHLTYDDGILLVSNHRSFFDMYMLLVLLHRFTPLRQPPVCPVRADFFYQKPAGVVVNLAFAGGRMYPPFFREVSKQDFNKWAIAYVAGQLRRGKIIVGYHPEGTRNRNESPYEPLPAQPGVGKLVMDTWPTIVPAFINGLSNNLIAEIRGNLTRSKCVIAVFGEPVDLEPFRSLGNRLSSHKRIADALVRTIYGLGEAERSYRKQLQVSNTFTA